METGPVRPGSSDDPTDAVVRALAEPHRRIIPQLVTCDELAAGEIASVFEFTRPAGSQHAAVLKSAGLMACY